MSKRKIGIMMAAGVIAAGLGVASALADTTPAGNTSTATSDVQGGQQGVDEQGAANDVADAADDVQAEAASTAADDQSGDQQGPNDQSEEQGDNGQSGQEG
ncbi:hypothetical protein Gocc_0362 [Gaiella occulta]|uniref:Collagen triple helix repeat (20 copies) n=1 Tax=Gaiella occulta TaxID=1002870 RepID=A0A7M2Z2F7_9ACTN|nr:hypothetical protein [Gaiella occulta]RDI75943.1 hypothetical protein Gocc_0362 [Gaiella occulta]